MFSGINNEAQRENNFPTQHTETLISLLNATPLHRWQDIIPLNLLQGIQNSEELRFILDNINLNYRNYFIDLYFFVLKNLIVIKNENQFYITIMDKLPRIQWANFLQFRIAPFLNSMSDFIRLTMPNEHTPLFASPWDYPYECLNLFGMPLIVSLIRTSSDLWEILRHLPADYQKIFIKSLNPIYIQNIIRTKEDLMQITSLGCANDLLGIIGKKIINDILNSPNTLIQMKSLKSQSVLKLINWFDSDLLLKFVPNGAFLKYLTDNLINEERATILNRVAILSPRKNQNVNSFHDVLRFTDNMTMYALCVCFLIKNLKLTNSTSQHFQSKNVGLIKQTLINAVKNGFTTDSIEVLDKKIANFEGTPLSDLYNQLIRGFLRTCQPIPSHLTKLISN